MLLCTERGIIVTEKYTSNNFLLEEANDKYSVLYPFTKKCNTHFFINLAQDFIYHLSMHRNKHPDLVKSH